MWSARLRNSGVQGAALVAITYVYFLIFAQFAFLHRLDALGIIGEHLKPVMAAMAMGGILLSLMAPRWRVLPKPERRMQTAFAIAGVAALLSLLTLNPAFASFVALLIGAGLGLLTVTLVTHLRRWTGTQHALMKVGFGTGISYLICNVPSFFASTPRIQAIAAAALCLIGAFLSSLTVDQQPDPEHPLRESPEIPFAWIIAAFTALIWLDSAAFYIVQNTASLKAAT